MYWLLGSYRSKINCCCTKQSLNQYELWDTAFNSNMEIIQKFQNKYLRIIVNASCYVTNDTLHHNLNVPYVRDEIKKLNQRYRLKEYISD